MHKHLTPKCLPQHAILTNSVFAVMQISQSTSEGLVYAVVAGLTARQKQHCSAQTGIRQREIGSRYMQHEGGEWRSQCQLTT